VHLGLCLRHPGPLELMRVFQRVVLDIHTVFDCLRPPRFRFALRPSAAAPQCKMEQV
jgi:hypothetical protein